MKVNILNKKIDGTDFVDVYIKEGVAPKPYDKSLGLVPHKDGLICYVKDNGSRLMQVAARNIGNFGLFNIVLKTDYIANFKSQNAIEFIMGLYDGEHDLNVVMPFDNDILHTIQKKCNLLIFYRDLANKGSSEIWPRNLITKVFDEISMQAKAQGGEATLKLIDRDSDEFSTLSGLKAVGHGSMHSPCMGIIDFIPKNLSKHSDIHICLVGKGITFDSGGYNIKTGNYMTTMRTDKSGAVYMAAALSLAILNGLHKRVRLYMPCSQNLISATSMVPGDIISYPNDVTVEVGNTDAEGRLVLADALIMASNDKPFAILDAATLTGAAKIAVGRDMTLISTLGHNDIVDKALDASLECDELSVFIPTYEFHKRYISSKRATINNTSHGDGAPGALTATAFLSYFVKNDNWVHFDLSSAYCADGSPWYAQGSTGSMIQTIASTILKI